jgi:uncharacterized protein YlxP (DUF503 family)
MITPPDDPKAEIAVAAARGLVSAIPFAGGLISEIGNLYLNPLERRKQQWTKDVSDALNQIKEEFNLLPEQLQESESFISALYQATEIAMRNHQIQKRAALRNALVSSAASTEEYDLETRMLRYVGELSLTHISVLNMLNLHADQFALHEKLDQVYEKCCEFQQKEMDAVVFRSILQDLETRFLITLGDVEDFDEFKSRQQSMVTEDSRVKPLSVTRLGKSFLAYIRADQL